MKFLQHIYHYINNKANEYWVTIFVGFAFYFFEEAVEMRGIPVPAFVRQVRHRHFLFL